MLLIDKEVYFHKYCPQCKHYGTPEWEDPCDICLEIPSNQYSHKPREFEPKELKWDNKTI